MFKITGMISTTVTGRADAGPVSAPGVKAGDWIIGTNGPFGVRVTVDDQIQQEFGFGSSTEGVPYDILVFRE